MTTHEHVEPETAADADGSDGPADEPTDEHPHVAANWWHRKHPIFTSLVGFFTGLVVVIVVPGTFGAILNGLFDDDTAARLFPFALVIFGVPLVLIAVPRTRRFGGYMMLGMVVTAIVVLGVAALTLWALISNDR